MKTLGRARDAAEIRARLGALTPAARRQWGSMSVVEMLCHVREAFRVALGQVTLQPVKPPMPPLLLKWMALRAPARWPQSVPTVPGLARGEALMQTAGFAEDHRTLLAAFEEFVVARELRTPHPILGAMGPEDWGLWGYRHTDHHLRQFGL